MLLEERPAAEEVPAAEADRDPGDRADHAEQQEATIVHPADAGDEGGEGADDRDEAGEDDGFGAMRFVERLGFGQVLFAEELGVFPLENRGAEAPAEPVVDVVADQGRANEQRSDDGEVDADVPAGDGADRKDQRIARTKRQDHQPGFAEDYGEKDGVKAGEDADVIDHIPPGGVFAEVAEQGEELLQKDHKGGDSAGSGLDLPAAVVDLQWSEVIPWQRRSSPKF